MIPTNKSETITASSSFFLLSYLVFIWIPFTFSAMTSTKSPSRTGNTYDLLVIGGGSAGITAAKFAGETLGKSVLLIEKSKLGGDCTWTGCVPSKSLLASAKNAAVQSQLLRKQIIKGNDNPNTVNFQGIQEKYRRHQQHIYDADDSPEALSKYNIDTLQGKATFISSNTLQVTTTTVPGQDGKDGISQEYIAKEGIVLCTGATPRDIQSMNIPGLKTTDNDNNINVVTYEEIWDIPKLPKRLTIVGGGPIGCEFAQAFARLGAEVTMIVSKRLLPREELEVSDLLKCVFEGDENITILTGKLESVRPQDGGEIGNHIASTATGQQVSGDLLLVAVGRTPNTQNFGLESVGVKTDSKSDGGIVVNEKLQTSVKSIYAAGDCISNNRQFTHYAGYQGAIACRNILLPLSDPGVLSPLEIPATTFTSPEIASVGYTEEEAKTKYGANKICVATKSLQEVDRAICEETTKGLMKVIYKKSNGHIVGATMMCPHAGELISEICVAIKCRMPFWDIAKVIHPYPSYAIALQQMSADVYYERTKKSVPLYNILKKFGV